LTINVQKNYKVNITLQQVKTLDAVVKEGSIQAAAEFLNKTHPSVIALLNKLEQNLQLRLFDRSGYRLRLTDEGEAFYKQSQQLLKEMETLEEQAALLREGEEAELNIVIGDLTPIPEAMQILRNFSLQYPSTRLNFLFENLNGPNEKLLHGEADLIIHHINQSDPRYEYRPFCEVDIVPVAAPGFVQAQNIQELSFADLKGQTQCIIRDTSTIEEKHNFFILENNPHITVGDQRTKKEIIVQSMAWGHMPRFLVEQELQDGSLISLRNPNLQGQQIEINVVRLRECNHGIVANKLWDLFAVR